MGAQSGQRTDHGYICLLPARYGFPAIGVPRAGSANSCRGQCCHCFAEKIVDVDPMKVTEGFGFLLLRTELRDTCGTHPSATHKVAIAM